MAVKTFLTDFLIPCIQHILLQNRENQRRFLLKLKLSQNSQWQQSPLNQHKKVFITNSENNFSICTTWASNIICVTFATLCIFVTAQNIFRSNVIYWIKSVYIFRTICFTFIWNFAFISAEITAPSCLPVSLLTAPYSTPTITAQSSSPSPSTSTSHYEFTAYFLL